MDIAPELLEKIERQFFDTVSYGKEIGRLSVRIADGVATYKEAEEHAVKVGEALAQAFRDNLSSDILPDGKMYFNIANRVVREPMEGLYELVAEAARQVQQSLNEAAGIRIRPQVPALDTDRIDGIVNRLASEEHFDDVAWILGEPVVNFAQHAVDESIRKNVDFHARSGLEPKITRTAESGACKWCRELAGTYTYGDVRYQGAGVWRRHENCRCLIEYIPKKGRRQTVYNYREANTPEGRATIERRKKVGKYEESFMVPRGAGANFRDAIVTLPNGEATRLTPGKPVTNIETIAGMGRKRKIDEIDTIMTLFPESNEVLWKKRKGIGYVDYDGESYKADIHWYEEPSVGKVKFKVKPDAAGNWFYED